MRRNRQREQMIEKIALKNGLTTDQVSGIIGAVEELTETRRKERRARRQAECPHHNVIDCGWGHYCRSCSKQWWNEDVTASATPPIEDSNIAAPH